MTLMGDGWRGWFGGVVDFAGVGMGVGRRISACYEIVSARILFSLLACAGVDSG
jgi:hypothetical protein